MRKMLRGASTALLPALVTRLFYVHRACFDKLQVENYICWLVLDYISDFIYLIDTCVRLRTGNLLYERAPGHRPQTQSNYNGPGAFSYLVLGLFPPLKKMALSVENHETPLEMDCHFYQ